jgi:DNA polymerase III delta subunit
MIQLIEGDDAFLRAEALAGAVGEGDDLCSRDGDGVSLGDILDEARTLSFLGRRVVHVRDSSVLVNENAEALAAVAHEPIALLLEAAKFDRRRKGMKALLKAARLVECNTPATEPALLAFVRRRAKHHATEFSRGADVALVRRLGGHGVSLQSLDAEIAKLSGQAVTVERVDQLVGAFSAHDSFALVDAIGAGRVGPALATLGAMLRDGAVAKGGKRERDPVAVCLMLLGALRWDLGRKVRDRRMTPALREWLQRRHGWLREADGSVKRGADPLATLTVLVTRMARERAP